MTISRRSRFAAVGLAASGLTLAGAASLAAAPASSGQAAHANAAGPFKIYLSNTDLDNGWRLEMQSIAKNFVARTAPYNKKVQFQIINGTNSVAGQIASIEAILPDHPNAIVIDANSPTALNPVLNQAIAQGAYVVWFDTPLSNAKTYGVTTIGGLTKPAYSTALWLIHSMGDKGNLVINNGVLGTGGEEQQNAGVLEAAKQFPKVHVVAQFSGQWATAPSASDFEQIMATHPVINGVWDSGGESGVIEDVVKAHKPLFPIAGYTFNQYFEQCHQYKAQGLQCAAASYPATLGAQAIMEAVGLLEGKHYAKVTEVPYQVYTNNGVKTDVPTLPMPAGDPSLPLEFTWPYNPPGANLTISEVINGEK
jgi:ribose transport system substrate-binding protein